MVYRNKLYIAFDGDNDMRYYSLLEAWRDNDKIDFGFFDAHDINTARDSSQTESIRARLRERMRSSKLMLLLVGEKTHLLRRFVAWEIEYAHTIDPPIVVANLNKKREYDQTLCPSAIVDGDVYTVHISFERDTIKFAVDSFPDAYRRNKGSGGAKRHYTVDQYRRLGL